jgi:hypothetical protein
MGMDEVEGQLSAMMGQAMAGLTEAMTDPKFEYRLALWEEVNPLARDGWALVPITPPSLTAESWQNLGYPDAVIDMAAWVMCRKLGPADAADDLLRRAAILAPPADGPAPATEGAPHDDASGS